MTRSSYCEGGACVDVTRDADGFVRVRDEHGGSLRFSPRTWAAELEHIVTYGVPRCSTWHGDSLIWVAGLGIVRFTRAEIVAFRLGIEAGELTYDQLDAGPTRKGVAS